jgi:hypothetical protein
LACNKFNRQADPGLRLAPPWAGMSQAFGLKATMRMKLPQRVRGKMWVIDKRPARHEQGKGLLLVHGPNAGSRKLGGSAGTTRFAFLRDWRYFEQEETEETRDKTSVFSVSSC